ncbi:MULTISPECIES: NAD(P)/FAD-dependent oxidoreductase [unclassified Coleofasciculus]|uniref:NAD(P)/FAD-dependent oxidoreductase n=1 Tax=unclassified Coleofasciculus TaxID=2692782 RepID=UPI00187FCAE2|nr:MULTISPECIES: NAD(P)/FAD-dependent oxidoreductase [unclassified Coleofasciculus]MBE9130184.1 NAD(P)/FAD-dependent oxidoreductase [Coleofasciculus sp. LEGE 07081]MBE9150276.1 NAD(P)/FAD-dependent oxidoreductase [Coleofasciculus sp. LEGE 07092]
MQSFDVVVVGAGPAGGQCARLLAKSDYKVLLVEQHEDFYKNDFSSAATPLETLERFDLPQDVVGSFWQNLVIVTTTISKTWESSKTLGAVLNFAKFREFLAKEVQSYGSDVWMGCRYIRHESDNGNTRVELKKRGGDAIAVRTKVLVDATGPARAVMYAKESDKPAFLKPAGIEYLIEVPEETYNKYAKALIFFLGHKWMPKGYSWIFPMEKNRLKVGAASYRLEHEIITYTKPIKYYIDLLIKEYIQPENYKIIDIHGSTLQYSSGLKDVYYQDNIIAIGDAVSTVNFLGGEGIRHAMDGAEIANKQIQLYLKNKSSSFKAYQREMQRKFANQWNLSEKIGMKRYLVDSDEKIDWGVAYLSPLKIQDMMDILFYYKFEKLSKGLGGYLLRKLRYWWSAIAET